MPVRVRIKPGAYYDSIKLMLVASELRDAPGVEDTAVVMATDANKAILQDAGLLTPEAAAAAQTDLIIAVRTSGAGGTPEAALAQAEALLREDRRSNATAAGFRPRTLRSAVKAYPQANVAVISVAGRYAADEAWDALRQGLHVLLFSDNVSVEDEVALKTYARDRGLLLMGPGAGTTLLNGVALGFANVVPPGRVGVVSAAGTGLQEVTTLLARRGVGITQGLGVGGRDLSVKVGGLMMLEVLRALQADPDTGVLVLISKPPAVAVARRVLAQVAQSDKPTVVCFLGGDAALVEAVPHAYHVPTLEAAARLAADLAGTAAAPPTELAPPDVETLRARLQPAQRWLRGLFSGGTLCYEAQVIWRDALDAPVWSNAPLAPDRRLASMAQRPGHTAVDLGEEEFTVGRLHPMIDNALRVRRMLRAVEDPSVAVVVLDVVLGYGAHPDPALELSAAVVEAREVAQATGRDVLFVASVTGTDADPQSRSRQVDQLEQAGVVVCASNAAAARLAARIVRASA